MDTPDAEGAGAAGRTVIYLDHAATSWPKPPAVVEAMVDAMERAGGNPGRGGYPLALAASRVVFASRKALAELLRVPDPRDLLLLSGATEGCNLMLKGLIGPGDRVVVSSMEHNAVTRPLHMLAQAGARVDVMQADGAGRVDPDKVIAALREGPTRAVVCQHASNVTGTVQPIADLADIAHEAGALMLVDGAQGVGHLDIDLSAMDVDAYAASGHKGLLGPQGVGILYLRPGLEARQLIEGGTGGASSDEPGQPQVRPDRYEAGTPNTPGIAGLGAAAHILMERGEEIRATEQRLSRRVREALSTMKEVRLLSPGVEEETVPTMSLTSPRMDPDRIAFELDRRYGISVRAGVHCAPAAHRTIGTISTGAVRIGLGYTTTDADVDTLIGALTEILS